MALVVTSIRRRVLFDLIFEEKDHQKHHEAIFRCITGQIEKENLSHSLISKLDQAIYNILSKFKEKFCKHGRRYDNFIKQERGWLEECFVIPDEAPVAAARKDPPPREFDGLSESQKRRRTASLRAAVPASVLTYAAATSLHQSGHRGVAESLRNAATTEKSRPTAAAKVTSSNSEKDTAPRKFTDDEALALFDHADLTKEQYIFIKRCLKEHNVDVLPCYDYLRRAKQLCYPADHSKVTASESEASIEVQGLFDLTAKRFAAAHMPLFESVRETRFIMLWKWGYDAASAFAEYQQNAVDPDFQEGSIIFTSAALIQVLTEPDGNGHNKLIYQTDRPGSPRYSRPIQLLYKKETKQIVNEIHDRVQAQMNNLVPTIISLPNEKSIITITHRSLLSMIDGKICSILTNVAPQNCNICLATPSCMNKIDDLLTRPLLPNGLKQYISVLHAWIRFLEACLHIAYRLTIKHAYSQYSANQKLKMARQEQKIKKNLKEGLSITVDKVKSGGYGNTMDGNLARRFFKDPNKTASLTGLDSELLERIRVILVVITSCFVVNIDSFREYCLQTARDYVRLYNWYFMPCAVHKVLIHAADVMKIAPVPLGLLTEEALEACHKKIKHTRRHHTRLCSRTAGNTDLLQNLLVYSDPLLHTMRPKAKGKVLHICDTVRSLLKEPPVSGVLESSIFSDSGEEL